MPPSALERIGVDAERNQAILDSIADLPEDATVLLFATSVAHAELLAGLLSLEGIPAQAVSGRTLVVRAGITSSGSAPGKFGY